jgi:hypothetical protein
MAKDMARGTPCRETQGEVMRRPARRAHVDTLWGCRRAPRAGLQIDSKHAEGS